MATLTQNEAVSGLLAAIGLPEDHRNATLARMAEGESKYLRDLKMNLKATLASEHLTKRETALLALAAANNERNTLLEEHFASLAAEHGATPAEIADTLACTSLLSSNNVFYRFRHFVEKEKYQQLPAKLRMGIMMKPVLGKAFFELVSLAVSAINGCEMCVRSHEESLIALGTSEEQIFDAARLAATVVSASKVIYDL